MLITTFKKNNQLKFVDLQVIKADQDENKNLLIQNYILLLTAAHK